jgi:CRP/FNR family cyclic AMP-dependent transcriptional regulator
VDGGLARLPLFAALDEESAATLEAAMTTRSVRRGHVIFSEGDEGDRLFVVLEGKVKIWRAAADGRENLLAVMGSGDMFGELSLFDPGPRTSSVSAVTDSLLASLDHDDLRPLLLEQPGVASQLLQAPAYQ